MYEATFQLFTLFYNVIEPEFFIELGYKEVLYDPANNKFNAELIKSRINAIVAENRKSFPSLSFVLDNLVFTSLNEFLYSFLNEITYLNFAK